MRIESFFMKGYYARVEVWEYEEDGLSARVWTFSYSEGDNSLKLSTYMNLSREIKRKKLRSSFEQWERLDKRNSNIKTPPVPSEEVLVAAKEEFIKHVIVTYPEIENTVS